MSVEEAFAGIETVGTVEHSLVTDTSGPDVSTAAGDYQAFVDLSALVAGDEYEWKAYEKTRSGGTQRATLSARIVGVQSTPIWSSPPLKLLHGWDMTLKKIAGTDRSIEWSIRKPIAAGGGGGSVNVATIDAAAVTSIQAGLALSTQVDTVEASLTTALADIDDVQARLPAALVAGKMSSHVVTIADNALTAAAVAADAATKIGASLLATVLDGARTVKGALVRLNALTIGKATGLHGPTAAFFKADGVTKAIEATMNEAAGTREAASTASGD